MKPVLFYAQPTLPQVITCERMNSPKRILDFTSFPNYNAKGSGLPNLEHSRLELGPSLLALTKEKSL